MPKNIGWPKALQINIIQKKCTFQTSNAKQKHLLRFTINRKAVFFRLQTETHIDARQGNSQESCRHSSCALGRICSPAPMGRAGSHNAHFHAANPDSTASYKTPETRDAARQ